MISQSNLYMIKADFDSCGGLKNAYSLDLSIEVGSSLLERKCFTIPEHSSRDI